MSEQNSPSKELVVASITAPEEAAAAIAISLVERRMAACVNVISNVRSVYRWQGAVETAAEALLVVKTLATTMEPMTALLREIHPYENYELVAVPITDGSPAYLQWLAASVDAP